MANPRPVPPNRRVIDVSAWEKGVNISAIFASGMPIPVSATENLSRQRSPVISASSAVTAICPAPVNFTALPARFRSTCPNRRGSPTRQRGTSFPMELTNSTPFSAASTETMSVMFSSTSSNRKEIESISSFPASILEKSRISLITASNERADDSIFSR